MGRNGSGKSVAAVGAAGQRSPRRAGRSGSAALDPARLDAGRPARRWSGWCRRTPPTCSTSRRSPRSAPRPTAAAATAARSWTGWCPGIPDDAHPRDLSEGQRLALALALVLVCRAPASCSSTSRPAASTTPPSACWPRILRALAAEGHAVLVATHDVEFVAQVADDVVVLAEGEVVSSGPVRRVVAESPSFAPQVTKVLGAPWLRVDEVVAALGAGR